MRCYVFPGQGVQKKGMGGGLFEEFPDLCQRADEVLGYSVHQLCRDNPERRLSSTEYAQPAIYVVSALHYLAARRQGRPAADYLAGHSLGEYTALFAAGAFDFETGLSLVKRRAELMGQADGGGMAAVVGVSADVIEETLRANQATGVTIANYNAPEQVVLSGRADELARLRPIVEQVDGVRGFVPVRVSGAFHSPWMAPAAAAFRDVLDSVHIGQLSTPVISNVTGRPCGTGAQAVRESLAEQITSPVQWIECIRYLRGVGVSEFVELGESKVLTPLIDKIAAADQRTADPRQDVIARIRRDVLQPEIGDAALYVDENESLRRLGVDSIAYVRLARRIEAVFGVPCKPDLVYRSRSCAGLADHLLAQHGVATAEPTSPTGWHEYRDERVLALLRDAANGVLSVDQVIETISAGFR